MEKDKQEFWLKYSERIIKKFASTNFLVANNIEDFIQEAKITCLSCFDQYRENGGANFKTYLGKSIYTNTINLLMRGEYGVNSSISVEDADQCMADHSQDETYNNILLANSVKKILGHKNKTIAILSLIGLDDYEKMRNVSRQRIEQWRKSAINVLKIALKKNNI